MIKVSSLVNSANFKPLVLDEGIKASCKVNPLPDQTTQNLRGRSFKTVLNQTRSTK